MSCVMEKKRVVWFMALAFSVALLVQYIELPYGYVLPSLLSFGKSQVTSAGNFLTSFSNHTGNFRNQTGFNGAQNLHCDETNKPCNDSFRFSNDPKNDSPGTETDPVSPRPSPRPSNDPKGDFPGTKTGSYSPSPSLISSQSTSIESPPRHDGEQSVLLKTGKKSGNTTPMIKIPKKRRIKGPPSKVVPISTMNDMLHQYKSKTMKPRWPSQADKELLNAKRLIDESAPFVEKKPLLDVYRNFSAFMRSYELMEKTLKIYIYKEGEKPIFHQPELGGIYASEGWFMKQLEENKQFVTRNAKKAHLFYLPFSSRVLEEVLYVPNSHSRKNLVQYLSSYLETITTAHPYWNRTGGSDHFLVGCHDWAPAETSRIMKDCIRALCNADVEGGFKFGKDVSLPEIYIRNALNPLKGIGGKPPHQRKILAFFAGHMHGYLRPILLNHWENRDPDMKIFGMLRDVKGRMNYIQYMKSSKYCISAKGYEAYTPRVMEAIFYECVPVIISDNYIPPFFETLNWQSFAVFVLEKDIPDLKTILASIPQGEYVRMQERVKEVQKHFLWNHKPVKFDVFHMILHSIWYTKVYQIRL